MSTALDHFARQSIQSAMDTGTDSAIHNAAELAGVTDEQVRYAIATGSMPAERLTIDPSDPMDTARKIVLAGWSCGGIRLLNHYGGVFYEWRGGAHLPADPQSIRAGLWQWLESSQRVTGTASDGEAKLEPVKPNKHTVANIVEALAAVCNLNTRYVAPCWLENDPSLPPADETLAMSNGLLHLPTRTMYPADPRFWTHTAMSFGYQPDADDPAHWMQFLGQIFEDDPDSIDALQEWFGLMLLPDTRQQKILLVVGPKRSGKGTVARILTAMLGPANVCAPTLAGMSTSFGMAPLIGKLAAIISDARLSGRADQAAIAERLLSVSGEDSITIDRKHTSAWTGRLSTRFIILSNELPRLADASGALASRFIIIKMKNSFYGREDHGLYDRLRGELPGIFAWALAGYDRLRRRGHLIQPESARGAVEEVEDLGSPVSAFIRERCVVDPAASVSCEDIYQAWREWCQEQGRDHPGTSATLSRDLGSALPGLRASQPRISGKRIRVHNGIGLL